MEGCAIYPIEKEFLPFLTFLQEDVLEKASDKIYRSRLLQMATILGNCFKNKVTIVFKSIEGIKKVTATVWATTDDDVVLKGGITLPVRSILEVKLY